jgi:CheY-like chemotaxis protein/signal transduction histidine kinase
MKALRRLYHSYCEYHQHGPLMLRYLGIFGCTAFPLFYLLRFTKDSPPYDDLALRLVDAALCLALFLKDRWPQRMRPYFYPFSYAAVIFVLPYTFVFTALKNGGGTVGVGNTLMAAILVIFIADWRNTIVMMTSGIALAFGWYLLSDPNPQLPADYVARAPILLVVIVGGIFFKLAVESATADRVRKAYGAIAGSIAHEMRNPLTQIGHSLENLQDVLPPPGAAAVAQPLKDDQVDALYRHLADGEQAVRRGLQVISMTLDEVRAKPVDSASFALLSAAELAHKAVREYGFESDADRSRVAVELQEDFTLRGEETSLLFVLFNLIKNALYYAGPYPGTVVTLRVGGNAIRVHDTGPGIAREQVAQLFEPFRSVGKAGGTGLGLAYCQRVMASLGGRIECHSEVGHYTEFTLSFPTVTQTEQQAWHDEVVAQARAAFAGQRLLIVEDEAVQRRATRRKLLPLDAVIDEAHDGGHALELLNRHRYAMVLLDMHMPVLDGYALAEKVRRGAAPANRHVRIVAHTSEPAHLARVKAQKAGMDGFVAKPSSQLALLQALQRTMQSQRQRIAVANGALAGRRIVLADDSPPNRRAVAAYLRHAGVDVAEAGDGAQVLALLRVDGADAVLMDIHMPGMDGLETTRTVRASPASWSRVPILALSGRSDAAAMQEASEAGMNGFLVKPVEAGALFEALQAVIGETRTSDFSITSPPAGGSEPELLNKPRLDSYRRLGLLDELLADYVIEINRLVAALQAAAGERRMQETTDILHSLLGLSGEAGALLLHHRVRQAYVPMLERREWPADAQWATALAELARHTEQALLAYAAGGGVAARAG